MRPGPFSCAAAGSSRPRPLNTRLQSFLALQTLAIAYSSDPVRNFQRFKPSRRWKLRITEPRSALWPCKAWFLQRARNAGGQTVAGPFFSISLPSTGRPPSANVAGTSPTTDWSPTWESSTERSPSSPAPQRASARESRGSSRGTAPRLCSRRAERASSPRRRRCAQRVTRPSASDATSPTSPTASVSPRPRSTPTVASTCWTATPASASSATSSPRTTPGATPTSTSTSRGSGTPARPWCPQSSRRAAARSSSRAP